MKKLLLLVGLQLISAAGFSQVGIGNTNPDSSSLLDITATDKGILIPRVSLIDVTNVVSPVNNPTESLLVYNTNSSVTGGTGVGFYYFNGTSWEKITSTDSVPSVNLKDIGVISAFPGATYPNDMFLPISGGTFNDADYPEFAIFISNLDSDVVTNNGNGTFTLANWNNSGIFLRSIGGNAGSIGALQQDATALPNSSFLTASQSVLTNTGGSHVHSISTKQDNWDVSGGPLFGGPSFGIDNGTLAPRLDTDTAGNHNHNVTIPALNINGGDIETRPINRAITWVIKVKPSASSVNNLTINNITGFSPDDQNLTGATLTGTSLQIDIENGNSTTVNLAALQDGTGTDDQNITGSGLSGTNLTIGIENGSSQVVDLSSLVVGNTLDQAYDEGGSGVGRTITATHGAVAIAGFDGLVVTGNFNSGQSLSVSGFGTKMFFYPKKAAFRAGSVGNGGIWDPTAWDEVNIGDRSFAVNAGSIASGSYSFASGAATVASGSHTTSMGYRTIASEIYEMAIGSYNKSGASNRLFVIGNGNATRSNAFEVFNTGKVTINEEYSLPLTDGTANQVMQTNGAGQVSFVNSSSIGTDDQNLTGATLTGTSLQIDIENGNSATVNLAALQDGTGTDDQTIDTFTFNSGTNILTLEVENDGVAAQTVNLSSLQDGTGTDDQNLTGATLTGTSLQIDIENGNSATVNLASLQDGTGTDDQNITGSGLSGTNLTIGIENGSSQVINLASLQDGTGTDDQNITGSGLSGTNLTIGIENGTSQVINLASLQDGTGTDDQNITGSGLSGTNLTIGIENGSSQVINLAPLQDGTGTDDQNLTGAALTGTSLQIDIENGNSATVNLASLQDGTGTDDQNITGSGLSGTNLTIGIENGSSQVINLASLQDGTGTDDQTIDTFSFNTGTNILTLEVENDGIPAQTVDLSSLQNEDADWYEEGTTTAPNNINDDMFTQGNVAIGKTTANYPLDIETNTASRGINTLVTGNTGGFVYGQFIENSNSEDGTHFGSFNSLTGTGNGDQHGSYQHIYNTGNGIHYGSYNILSGTGVRAQYGSYQYIYNTGNGEHYGSSNYLSGSGTGNQFGSRQNIDNTGSGIHYGSYNLLKGTGTGTQYGSYQNIYNTGSGAHYGSRNNLSGSGTGNKYGSYSYISDFAGGTHYGIYSDVINPTGYAGYFIGRMSLGNTTSNRYLMPAADGNANYIMQTNGSGQVSFVDPLTIGDGTGTDDQNITGSGLSGTNLTIGIENGSSQVINLASLQDGIGTDDQNITGSSLSGTNLTIGIENGTSQVINLSSLQDGIGATKIDELTDGKSDATGSTIFLGNNAGAVDDGTANNNIGIGLNSLLANTSGGNNIAIGANALDSNINANYNIAIGTNALNSTTNNGQNLALGFSSMASTVDGNSNVALGHNALTANISGDNNVILGHGAGIQNNGSGNIFIGKDAGSSETAANNKLFIDNTGTNTPLIYGDFSTNEIGINWSATVALPNTLSVNGNASKSTAGNWLANSDRRLKKEIETINGKTALEKINQLRGVTYKWNDDKTGIDRPTEIQYGFIAQELMEVFPSKVSKDKLGYYQTAYGDYDALFVQAFKELTSEITALSEKNKQQEQEIETLKKQLLNYSNLEARLTALENENSSTKVSENSLAEKK